MELNQGLRNSHCHCHCQEPRHQGSLSPIGRLETLLPYSFDNSRCQICLNSTSIVISLESFSQNPHATNKSPTDTLLSIHFPFFCSLPFMSPNWLNYFFEDNLKLKHIAKGAMLVTFINTTLWLDYCPFQSVNHLMSAILALSKLVSFLKWEIMEYCWNSALRSRYKFSLKSLLLLLKAGLQHQHIIFCDWNFRPKNSV